MKGKKVIAILLVLMAASGVLFADTTGSIQLKGTINLSQSLAITPATGYNALDLTTSQTGLKVADLLVSSNFKAYIIQASSVNASKLLGEVVADQGTEFMEYQIALVSDTVTGSMTTLTTTATTIYTGTAKATDYPIVMNIAYTGKTDLQADIYTDTVTLAISKN